MFRRLVPFLFVALASTTGAQAVGSKLPTDFDLSDFTRTGATSLADFQGRAILLEFFAYW